MTMTTATDATTEYVPRHRALDADAPARIDRPMENRSFHVAPEEFTTMRRRAIRLGGQVVSSGPVPGGYAVTIALPAGAWARFA